jgi:mono/diheme cytochrome c family protein
MIRPLLLAAALLAAPIAAPLGVSGQPALDGKALFHTKCGMCHAAGGMGTGLLARRVQPAELEKRSNLTADYVFQFARRGSGNMPPITPGDVSAPQLKAIAAYLASGPHEAK